MRFTDLMMAFPALLLAIVPGGVFQPEPVDRGHGDRAGELGADGARHLHRDPLARRARVHRRRAHASAPARARILFRHILPHLLPTIIVWGTLGIVDHRAARGDAQLSRHRRAAADSRPGATSSSRTRPTSRRRPGWCSSPAPRSWLLALAFNLVGDALRDILDPTQRGRGMMRLSRPPPDPVGADPARRLADHLRCCSTSCRPIRRARSPGAARRRRRSRTSAASSASTSPSSCSTGAISASLVQRRSRPLLHPADRSRPS